MIPIICAVTGVAVAGGAVLSALRKSDTPYDIVVDINSLQALGRDGWKILLGTNTATPQNQISNESAPKPTGVVVAVLGCYNRGKTFLLNQLGQIKLPSGKLVHTSGISMAIGKGLADDVIFLDTAGNDAPIPTDQLDDMKATEALLRELVIELSSIIIVVVNRLRSTDQVYIDQMLKKLKESKREREVIIVHNLEDVERETDMERVIEKEIKGILNAKSERMSLPGNRGARPIEFFVSKQHDYKLQHFVMAKINSEAAKKWNQGSIDAMLCILQTTVKQRKPLDLIPQMIAYVNSFLPQLFVTDSTSNNVETFEVDLNQNHMTIVLLKRVALVNLTEISELKVKSKLNYDSAGYFIGVDALPKVDKWVPAYNLYETSDKYILLVELAGCDDDSVVMDINTESLQISGQRSHLVDSGQDGMICVKPSIEEGSFELNVGFERPVLNNEAEFENYHGLYKISLPKRPVTSSRPKKKVR